MSASILRYFKPRDGLPDPNGSLSASLPSQAIAAVNREVKSTKFISQSRVDMNTFETPCCVRGYHIYKDIWTAAVGEILFCVREPTNASDRYAVAVTRPALRCVYRIIRSLRNKINMKFFLVKILRHE